MHSSVKATIACAVFAAIAVVVCPLLALYGNLPFEANVQLVSFTIGAGVLLLSSLGLLQYQWHQPMWKEH